MSSKYAEPHFEEIMNNSNIYYRALKEFSEPFDELTVREKKAYAMKYNLHIEDQMFVVPVPFHPEGAKMLQHAKWLMTKKSQLDKCLYRMPL